MIFLGLVIVETNKCNKCGFLWQEIKYILLILDKNLKKRNFLGFLIFLIE
jgi:hypothetical protein